MEVHDSLTPWSPNTRRRGSKLATPHLKEEMRDDQCLGIFDVGLEGQLQLLVPGCFAAFDDLGT